MAKCQHEGCEREAEWMPKLCVPWEHTPIDTSPQSFGALMSWKACEEHVFDYNNPQLVIGPLKPYFRFIIDSDPERRQLDFDRAFFIKLSIGSDLAARVIKAEEEPEDELDYLDEGISAPLGGIK